MVNFKHLVYCVVLLNIFLVETIQDQLYSFSPESRTIEINENEDIYMSFYQIGDQTKFTHCYIESDVYIADYALIENVDNNLQTFAELTQGFFTNEDRNNCGFKYYSADTNTPRRWIVTAYDINNEQNYTEEVTVSFYYNMALYSTNSIVLFSGASANFFYNENITLNSCQIALFKHQLIIDLNMNSMDFIKHDNLSSGYLSTIGGKKCGYKFTNITNDIDITLLATDDQGRVYRNCSKITVATNSFLEDRVNEVHLGDSTNVICGKETDTSADFDQKFCHLYNPQGVLVSYDLLCNYLLEIVTVNDLGIWKCIVGFDYIMETLEFTTELTENKREIVETITEEDEFFYILGCQLVNFNSMVISYCKFTRPDGTIFKVVEGGTTTYYNTFTADLNNGRCALEIVKPLREEDKGTWICEAFTTEFGLVGTLINVIKTTTVSYINGIEKNIHLGSSFVVDCMLSYTSNLCHIIAPNGTEYEPDLSLKAFSNLCTLTIEHATKSDNGTWSCSIGQNNGIPDEIVEIEISVIEVKLLYSDVEVTEYEEVELVCSTNGIPLEYCRFVDPTGTSYSLKHNNSTNNKISYSGRGLKYGDCGLKISDVDTSSHGIWTCHISTGRINKATLKSEVKLTVLSISTDPIIAESVGIIGGLLIILTVSGGFVYYKYADKIKCYRKNQTKNESRNSTENTNSETEVANN